MDYGQIKGEAKQALSGKWGLAIGVYLLYSICAAPLQFIPKVGIVLVLIVSMPLLLGYTRFNLKLAKGEDAKIDDLFSGFSQFGPAIGVALLSFIYIFLWSLLLIIPGIIAGYGYSMIFYILAEEPDLAIGEILAKSKKMMDGYKMDLFILHLSFIGWALLCVLTLFIGFLWLAPWIQVSTARFYLKVKEDWELKNGMATQGEAVPVV